MIAESPAPLIVVMGVAGSGKTTVGRLVAAALHLRFVDGDDHHTEAARAAMGRGVPLDDATRREWGNRLHAVLEAHLDTGVVLACSALRESFRRDLRRELPPLSFVLLVVAEAELQRRLETRVGHFAPASLLPSQLAALELADDVVALDANRNESDVAADIVAMFRPGGSTG